MEFGTIRGLVLDRLGRAPEASDQVDAEGYRLTVEAVDGTRITSVGIDPLDDPEAEEGETDTDDRGDAAP